MQLGKGKGRQKGRHPSRIHLVRLSLLLQKKTVKQTREGRCFKKPWNSIRMMTMMTTVKKKRALRWPTKTVQAIVSRMSMYCFSIDYDNH